MGFTDKDELLFLFLLVASGIFALVLMCIFENFRGYILVLGDYLTILVLRGVYKNYIDDYKG